MSYKLLKELQEPSVITDKDPDDPNNPEVYVSGVARYKLKQIEKNVQEKFADLSRRGFRASNSDDWKQLEWMINHVAMKEMIKTIIAAKEEIEDSERPIE